MMVGLDIIDQKITLKNYKMKKKALIIALAISLFSSCKEKSIESVKSTSINEITAELSKNSEVVEINFLENLDDICVEDDGVFKNCDELFSKDGASLFFIIIPKEGAKNWYDKQTKNLSGEIFEINNKLTDQIEKIRKEDLSKEFDIWLFYTDKKYTEYVGMDSPYNYKTPRITELYFLKSGKNDWIKLESFKINNDKDETKETEWRSTFIDKVISKSNENSIESNTSIVSRKWIGKYSTYFSYGKIGGDNAGWILEIEIKEDEIKATGDGYQISFTDLLIANENNNELTLNHLKNVYGYKQGSTMKPEFILIEDNGQYFIKSKWIDSDIVTKSEKLGYGIDKE